MANKEIITGYKAFNHDLTCSGFQYEIGKTYKIEGDIELGERGFHFCPNPFDVFSFYPVIDEEGNMRRFAKVSAPASKAISGDKTTVTSELTVVDELMFDELVIEQIRQNPTTSGIAASYYDEYVAVSGDCTQVAASDYDGQVAVSGVRAKVATSYDRALVVASGDHAKVVASGDCANLAASGDYAQVAASGYGAQVAASGNDVKVAASGYGAKVAASGYDAQVVASYDRAKLAVSGDRAKVVATGKNSVIAISGRNGRFKGVNGTFVSCADFDDDGKCNGFVTGCVGVDGLKENTWYTVSNGKFVECEAQSC